MKNKVLKTILISVMALGLGACEEGGQGTEVSQADLVSEDRVEESLDKGPQEENDEIEKETIEVVKEDKEEESKDDKDSNKDSEEKETKKDSIEVKKEDKKEDKEEASKDKAPEENSENTEKTKDARYTASLIAEKKGEPEEYLGPTVYDLAFDGDYLLVSGSMDISTNPDDYQDKTDLQNEKNRKFKVNENTVFQAVGGMAEPEIFSRDEFINWYKEVANSGLGLIIMVEDGVAKTVSISS